MVRRTTSTTCWNEDSGREESAGIVEAPKGRLAEEGRFSRRLSIEWHVDHQDAHLFVSFHVGLRAFSSPDEEGGRQGIGHRSGRSDHRDVRTIYYWPTGASVQNVPIPAAINGEMLLAGATDPQGGV